MKVWSVVVLLLKREFISLYSVLLVCNFVMEWTAAITGDMGRKFWGDFLTGWTQIIFNCSFFQHQC